MEKRGEPPGAQLHDAKAVATSSPSDAGPWRRGMIVTRDQADSSQRASATGKKVLRILRFAKLFLKILRRVAVKERDHLRLLLDVQSNYASGHSFTVLPFNVRDCFMTF